MQFEKVVDLNLMFKKIKNLNYSVLEPKTLLSI